MLRYIFVIRNMSQTQNKQFIFYTRFNCALHHTHFMLCHCCSEKCQSLQMKNYLYYVADSRGFINMIVICDDNNVFQGHLSNCFPGEWKGLCFVNLFSSSNLSSPKSLQTLPLSFPFYCILPSVLPPLSTKALKHNTF